MLVCNCSSLRCNDLSHLLPSSYRDSLPCYMQTLCSLQVVLLTVTAVIIPESSPILHNPPSEILAQYPIPPPPPNLCFSSLRVFCIESVPPPPAPGIYSYGTTRILPNPNRVAVFRSNFLREVGLPPIALLSHYHSHLHMSTSATILAGSMYVFTV